MLAHENALYSVFLFLLQAKAVTDIDVYKPEVVLLKITGGSPAGPPVRLVHFDDTPRYVTNGPYAATHAHGVVISEQTPSRHEKSPDIFQIYHWPYSSKCNYDPHHYDNDGYNKYYGKLKAKNKLHVIP